MQPDNRIVSYSHYDPYPLVGTGDYGIVVPFPYWLVEADAVFHNVSLETVLRRYLTARLQEVSEQ